MADVPKLTTTRACRVAGMDRDRLNEHIAAGHFQCAPGTVPGRARLFDPDDMIALRLFREFMDDGLDAKHAGEIACEIALTARTNPECPAISYVEEYMGRGYAIPSDDVPAPADWGTRTSRGSDIRKVTTYGIGKLRKMIANDTEEERLIIGEP